MKEKTLELLKTSGGKAKRIVSDQNPYQDSDYLCINYHHAQPIGHLHTNTNLLRFIIRYLFCIPCFFNIYIHMNE